MVDDVGDDEAMVFSKGFYDAIAAGQSPAKAYDTAIVALESEDFDPHIVAKLIAS
jgi:hypothetical protein